jgi:hypothetical protein
MEGTPLEHEALIVRLKRIQWLSEAPPSPSQAYPHLEHIHEAARLLGIE